MSGLSLIADSGASWPHPGRSRRVGHHSNVRFCSTAEQPNQIAEFKCWRRGSLLNESVTGNFLELNQNATIVDKPAWCRNTPSQLELVACKGDSCSSILTELCGYRPLGIMLSHTLKLSTSGTKPDIAGVPNPTWASRVGPRPTRLEPYFSKCAWDSRLLCCDPSPQCISINVPLKDCSQMFQHASSLV